MLDIILQTRMEAAKQNDANQYQGEGATDQNNVIKYAASKSSHPQEFPQIRQSQNVNRSKNAAQTIKNTGAPNDDSPLLPVSSTLSAETIPHEMINNHVEHESRLPSPLQKPLKVRHNHQPITGPVQIIDIPSPNIIQEFLYPKTGRLVIKAQQLETILSKVGERPVALLSIAGPTRQGKSFLLSFMLKYLHSLSINNGNPDPDWMGRNGSDSRKNESLVNGFKWRSGVERETVGIWMWPEPFTLRREDGLEFDVLLMDTQGVFDSHTDAKDWGTIVGLSLLTSSCLIFNNKGDLQENSLIYLKDFMDFGLMAKTSSSNQGEKPFQKLVFLIRDWAIPDDHEYGAEGGTEYLHSILAQRNSVHGSEIRNQIIECFDQLDCYLMPHPGDTVLRKAFDGSIKGMSPGFAEHIQLFIEHLFNTSDSRFPPKTLSGNLVTGQDLLFHFEQFVKVFNSDQMPSADDLNQATVLICNQSIVNKCTLAYMTEMNHFTKTRQRRFWLDYELNSIQAKAYTKAVELFETSRKMGSPDEIEKFKKVLLKQCMEYKERAVFSNKNNMTDQLNKAKEGLGLFFQKNINLKIMKGCKGRDDFVDVDAFEKIYEDCYDTSIKKLEKSLGLISVQMLPAVEVQRIRTMFQRLKEIAEKSNRMKKSDALNNLRLAITNLTGKYKLKLDAIIRTSKYWTTEELHKVDGILRHQSIDELCDEYNESVLLPSAKQQLMDSTQKDYIEITKLVESRNENFLLECSCLVTDLGKIYAEIVDENPLTGTMAEAHGAAYKDCIQRLKKFEDFDKLPFDNANKFIEDLNSSLSEKCLNLVEKWGPRKKQQLLKGYRDKMNEAYESGKNIFGEEQLNHKHSEEKQNVLEMFVKFLDDLPVSAEVKNKLSSTAEGMLKDLDAEIENHMKIIWEKEEQRLAALQNNINGFISQARAKYLKLSNSLKGKCHDEITFKQLHHELKEQVKEFFTQTCTANLTSVNLNKYIAELETYMDSIAQFKTIENGTILEITGVLLHLSQELGVIDHIYSSNARDMKRIKQVRWIASEEISINENLCGDFWSGTSVIFYAKKISVDGNERLIDVSGGRGKSAEMVKPKTPVESGTNGQMGEDGKPGESGGNIQILAKTIVNAVNLRIMSNGGTGGNGGPGGNGSNGKDGLNGNDRYQMTLEELENSFPSPARFADNVDDSLVTGKLSLLRFAKGQRLDIFEAENSVVYKVETEEGASFRYGFYEGVFKGLFSSRSFYVWFQGAPGTNAQPGGRGGAGGRGGNSGLPGILKVPQEYENTIVMTCRDGTSGREGMPGEDGKDGVDGKQGTDFAIVDPYAGLWVLPANLLSKRRFSGNLSKMIVEDGKVYKNVARQVNAWNKPIRWVASGTRRPEDIPPGERHLYVTLDDAAYCPFEQCYITFVETLEMRNVLQVHYPKDRLPLEPLPESQRNVLITEEDLIHKYGMF